MKPRPASGGAEDTRDARAIEEELRFHVEGRVEELMAQGLSPEEARRRALVAFGDVARVRAELRDINVERRRREQRRHWLTGWARNVRTGARRLRQTLGYTTVAVLTLALGIGASVAMFTVLNAVVLRPLPWAGSDRLVRIWPVMNFNVSLTRLVSADLPLDAATGIARWGLTLTGDGEPVVLQAAVVDAGYFDVFRVRPELGRVFGANETMPSRSDVVLLSHALWRSRYGGDPGVIGRRIQLAGYNSHNTRVIIGVLPAGHEPPGEDADVWIPLDLAPGTGFRADASWYVNAVVARLAPGATALSAETRLRAVTARLKREYPGLISDRAVAAATVQGLLNAEVGDVRPLLWTLLAAVALVLLIACGNLANLMLARSAGRRRLLAVQAALGASRWRLVREQLLESSLVASLGGALGCALAGLLLQAVRVVETSGLPRATNLAMDWRVLLFALGVTVTALLLAGVLPALRATSWAAGEDFSGARGGSRSRAAHRLNRTLLALQLGMATMLCTAAALVLSSFLELRAVDTGIDAHDVLEARVEPPADRFTEDMIAQYYVDLLARIRAIPGVRAAGASQLLLFTANNWTFPYLAEGHTPKGDQPLPHADFRIITPGYFDALDQPLLAGRVFNEGDRDGAPTAMVINQAMAQLLWPGQDPLGREIKVFGNQSHHVVGVVGDTRQHELEHAPLPEMYVAMAQWKHAGGMNLIVEGTRPEALAGPVRRAIRALSTDVPITEMKPLTDVLEESLARRHFVLLVVTSFGVLALVLGGLGVYGVMSHVIATRMPDFGVRLALGARPRNVLGQGLRSGLMPALPGLAGGLVGNVAAAGLVRRLLFQIPAIDPRAYILVSSVLLAVVLLASWLPARRAARTDPLRVLRAD